MSYEPLHHKYRPQTFAALVGQEAIATTLTNAIRTQRIAPAYLFTGPRGTGKTSSARILAKSLNCLNSPQPTESPCGVCQVCTSITSGFALDVIEVDAASNTGVDHIRELIERAQFAPVQCRYKVFVIDECHMLSVSAFNSLLKTLEEPPNRVVFVLATTDPQRVLPTIISRCQRFDFRRIPLEAMVSHLQHITAQENIDITPDALTLVAQVAQGGLRDAESLLDQLSLLSGVTVERVWDLVGAVPEQDLLTLSEAIASGSAEATIEQCRHLMDKGREPLVVLQNLAGFYRDLLIAKTAPTRRDLVALTPPTWNHLCEFAKSLAVAEILLGSQHLKNSEVQIKNSTQPRLWLEVTLLGLLPSATNSTRFDSSPLHNPLAERGLGVRSNVTAKASQSPLPNSTAPRRQPPPATPPQQTHKVESAPSDQAQEPLQGLEQQRSPDPATNPAPPSEPPSTPPAPHSAANGSAIPVEEPFATSDVMPHPTTPSVSTDPSAALEQVWREVLARVQPPFTQGLLRQHGRLLMFDGSVAQVGVSTQPLLKLAQAKLSNIEIAFEAVHKSKVKVSLQIRIAQGSNPDSVQEPSQSPNPLTPQDVVEALPREQATHPFPDQQGDRETVKQEDSPTFEPSPNPDDIAKALPDSQETRSPQVLDTDAEDIEKALGSLKQFFEGEIVELTSDFDAVEPAIVEQEPAEKGVMATDAFGLEQQTDAQNPPDLGAWQEDEEDDIPFRQPAPCNSITENLYDAWEIEVNRPGIWMFDFGF